MKQFKKISIFFIAIAIVFGLSIAGFVPVMMIDAPQNHGNTGNNDNINEMNENNDVLIEETEDLEIKPVESEEVLDQLGLSYNSFEDMATILQNQLITEPMTIEEDENIMKMVASTNGNLLSTHSTDDETEIEPGTRSGRADAGNNPQSAEELKHNGNWTGDWVDCDYNSNNQQYDPQDQDWFYILVEEKGNLQTEYIEIKINNSAPDHANDPRILICRLYDPVSIILSQTTYQIPGDNNGKSIQSDDNDNTDMSTSFLDLEVFTPQENGTISASPPISGAFLLQIYCISRNYEVKYNITSVKKSIVKPVVSPYDKNNYPDNATVPQQKTGVTGSLLQHKDHWDWYDISSFIDFQGDKWPNKLSYNLDITRESAVPQSYYSWTQVWIFYYNAAGSVIYYNGGSIDESGSPSITSNGPTVPIINNFEMYGEKAWIGLRVFSVGIDQGNLFPQVYDGSVDYDLDFDVVLQNQDPLLTNGQIDPKQDYYFMDDEITFKVKYRDFEDDAPQYVRITIDGMNYEMTGSGTNYVSGVLFTYKVQGSDLDDSYYPHTFNYSTSDGLLTDTLSLSTPNNEFKVIEDQTPGVWDTAPNKLKFAEDDEAYILPFNQIFEDVDPPDGLVYTIYDDGGYGQKYSSPRLDVFIIDKKKLRIELKPNQHGTDEILVRAKETLRRSTDTYEFFATYKFNISISSEEDTPVLNPIGKIFGYQDTQIYFTITAVDPDINTDDDDLTFKTNRSDGSGPDDLEGFLVIPDTVNNTKANISFLPTNEHVGTFLVKFTVTDSDDNEDFLDIEFEIANVNDPPVIVQVSKEFLKKDVTEETEIEMTTNEDEWFNITVEIEDLDISIGEKNDILFKLENHTFKENVNIDHAGGQSLEAIISVKPTNQEVGYNYINFSVHDGKGGSDSLTIKVYVENVNDPPHLPEIIKPTELTFSIVDEVMFEGTSDDDDLYIPDSKEELTYKWYLKSGDSYIQLEDEEPYQIIRLEFPTPFLPTNDEEIDPGNYTIRFEVSDVAGEKQYAEIVIRLMEDYDNDDIPDDWEVKFDLDPHNREDAFADSDNDGFINIKEYDARTNPRDPNSHPEKPRGDSEDYTALIAIVAVVIIIVILIVLFLMIRSKKKRKEDLEDLDDLAYPSEEYPESQISTPKGPGGAGAGPGFMPPPPPGVSPEMHIQIMKMMQAQAQQPQKPGVAGAGGPGAVGAGPGVGMGTGTGPKPQTNLPPPGAGPSTGIGVSPTLVAKLPPSQASSGPKTTTQSPSPTPTGSDSTGKSENGNGMKCPNCGIAVQSGWFLCPACKSPLN
jgi:hypothetical protein